MKFRDLEIMQRLLHARSILIRDFGDSPELENCARISIGSADDNDRLLAALSESEGMRNVG